MYFRSISSQILHGDFKDEQSTKKKLLLRYLSYTSGFWTNNTTCTGQSDLVHGTSTQDGEHLGKARLYYYLKVQLRKWSKH